MVIEMISDQVQSWSEISLIGYQMCMEKRDLILCKKFLDHF